MYPLYAYLRRVDDLGDDETRDVPSRQRALSDLRQSLAAALAGDASDSVLTALADVVLRFQIPVEHLTAVIDGVEMDLAGTRYETFADLEIYCQRVASAVGLACIHIWGFHGPRALEAARRCGIAFQLTNILRDLRDDLRHGRVYLPSEDFRRFHYTPEELEHGEADERFVALMQFEIDRAHAYFDAAAELAPLLEPDGQRVLQRHGRGLPATAGENRAPARPSAAAPHAAQTLGKTLDCRQNVAIAAGGCE